MRSKNILAGGPAGVDDEARVLLRHLGPADLVPLQAALLNEASGKVAGGRLKVEPALGYSRVLWPGGAGQVGHFARMAAGSPGSG